MAFVEKEQRILLCGENKFRLVKEGCWWLISGRLTGNWQVANTATTATISTAQYSSGSIWPAALGRAERARFSRSAGFNDHHFLSHLFSASFCYWKHITLNNVQHSTQTQTHTTRKITQVGFTSFHTETWHFIKF